MTRLRAPQFAPRGRASGGSRVLHVALWTVLVAAASCGRDEGRFGNAPATKTATGAAAERVTREELTTFLDWQAEMWDVMVKIQKEAMVAVNDPDPVKAAAEALKRNKERVDPLLAREPFKDTRNGAAMRAVMSAFYISGSFFRDEKELARLRASYGKELIDSIAGQEALFRDKLKRGWGHP